MSANCEMLLHLVLFPMDMLRLLGYVDLSMNTTATICAKAHAEVKCCCDDHKYTHTHISEHLS